MAQSTVKQFAAELGLPTALLLEQLKSAGVNKSAVDEQLDEADKTALLDYLRKEHGGAAQAPKNKITLTRKQNTEIKKTDSDGRARTIQVEVRKKRVLMRNEEPKEEVKLADEVEKPVEEPVVEEVLEPVDAKEAVEEPVVEEAPVVEDEEKPEAAEKTVKRKKQVLTPEQIALREQEAERHAKLKAFQQEDLRKKEELAKRRVEEEKKKAAEAEAEKKKTAKLSEGTLHKPAAKVMAGALQKGKRHTNSKRKNMLLLHRLSLLCTRCWCQKQFQFQTWHIRWQLKPMR